ncbi:hypothetical protein HJC23_007269 [Cyclotella cryptica]|uniref:Pseudouridine synthase RsuA/RluA-like domain-containing protein n=1 Tax=Cyclotella cryptica TaxID=29204 RepID=A0ABD3Q0Z0_9STRA|eukprot:CCRYP_010065-RA/>CCRYP_010065-RA protein AED:0.04 eAED:0.04 QI:0/0/0/1/1/1/2/0/463
MAPMAALANVPAHLTIKVLYSDDDIIVIEKPCDLRSVPGHATPKSYASGDDDDDGDDADSNGESPKANSHGQRLTAQEAWVKAIRTFAMEEGPIAGEDTPQTTTPAAEDTHTQAVDELIRNLSATADTNSVPRKCPTFERYCQRNRRRLLPSFPELDLSPAPVKTNEPPLKRQKHSKSNTISSQLCHIAQIAFSIIQQRQLPLMNLPQPTDDTESAIGQLRLLSFGDYAHNNHGPPETVDEVRKRISEEGENSKSSKKYKLHVVHRLDCQTSGIMVVARNPEAASTLCHQWRERQSVQKVYLAYVRWWPPYHEQNLQEGSIDLPLAASRTERIKWEVRPVEDGGKVSLTSWKVYECSGGITKGERGSRYSESDQSGITLELQPITGRTHQLRIHCAAVGSGIEGDSLYGDAPISWIGDQPDKEEQGKDPALSRPKTLQLHAHKLTFMHPKTGEEMTFMSPKPW